LIIHNNLKYDLNGELNNLSKEIDVYISGFDKEEKGEKEINKENNSNIDNNVEITIETNSKINTADIEGNTDEKIDKDFVSNILKAKLTNTEYSLRSLIKYIKVILDITDGVEINNNNNSFNDKNIDIQNDNMEVDEDIEEEMHSMTEDEDKNEAEQLISIAITQIFSEKNFEALKNLLSCEFLNHLLGYLNNKDFQQYLINDFDKMISIKEQIFDLEYYIISLINNIIFKLKDYISDINNNFLNNVYNILIYKMNNYEYINNLDFLTICLTCLRNLYDNFTNIQDYMVNT